MLDLDTALRRCPVIAILRGITPDEVADIGAALVDAGIAIIEVPLNSPAPLQSIERLAQRHAADSLIGAGTVMTPAEVTAVAGAGGRLIVMPHGDATVIRAAKAAGLACMPGAATPTEGFAARAAGADALKLFPAEALPPAVVAAWRAVFPTTLPLIPVGGITAGNMALYWAAGAAGFGVGSSLYKPGRSAGEVARNAGALIGAFEAAKGVLSA